MSYITSNTAWGNVQRQNYLQMDLSKDILIKSRTQRIRPKEKGYAKPKNIYHRAVEKILGKEEEDSGGYVITSSFAIQV